MSGLQFSEQSYMPVPQLKMAGAMVRTARATVRNGWGHTLSQLTDMAKFHHVDNGLTRLGSEKYVALSAHRILAIQDLLNVDVINRSAIMYDRFIYNHKLYSSTTYTRSKRHSNHCICFEHTSRRGVAHRDTGRFPGRPQ